MNLATKLRTISAEKGISQAEIARRSGLSTAKVSQLFNNQTKDPQISTLIALCRAFDITPSQLLEGVTVEK